jgi:SAM-dependent methyltransferase
MTVVATSYPCYHPVASHYFAAGSEDIKGTYVASNIYLNGQYAEKNPTFDSEDSPWKALQVLQMLKKHNLPISSVVEIGCGAGEILRQLQTNLPATTEFYGYDISPEAYALCQSRANEHLRFYCADLLTNPPRTFDLGLCLDVFEHIEDYFGFLRQFRERATYKIFHVPLDMSVQAVWRRHPILGWRERVGHLHYFMKDTALATLRDTGYEVRDWCYTAGGIERPRSLKQQLEQISIALMVFVKKRAFLAAITNETPSTG